uniref:Uncharacterized protein n=1 Tax=Tanacetum cinerariifolium TaxID=118510 RepID=A0A6L2J1G1_TANCI|nr:hypothetical protein [Tanacetum cinerariifolium]
MSMVVKTQDYKVAKTIKTEGKRFKDLKRKDKVERQSRKANDQRSQSMKEQVYNIDRDEDKSLTTIAISMKSISSATMNSLQGRLVLRIFLENLLEHLSDTKVFTVKMEILLEPTSNKLLVDDLQGKYGGSDKFFTGLLGLIKKDATCWISRWKVDNKTHKVYENILAKVMWITDGVLRHPVDSQAWLIIDEKFLKIAEDPRNLRLRISADGVDVNTGNRHHNKAKEGILWTTRISLGSNFNDQGTNIQREKNVAESIVETLLHVPGKAKDGVNARLDLAELGVKPKLFAMQKEDKTTLPLAGYTLTNAKKDTFCETLHNIRVPQGYCSDFSSLVNLKDRKLIGLKSHDYHMLMQEFFPIAIRSIMHLPTRYIIIRNKPKGCIAEETIVKETIEFFSEYNKSIETIGIPLDKHETDENEEEKPLSVGKLSEVSSKLFQKARLYVERELTISKESVSETVRWISYGPRATVVKYDAYNINGYTFHTKYHDGKVYQNSGVSVEAIDLHIAKEVATTRKVFYYGVLQEIWLKLLLLCSISAAQEVQRKYAK